MVVDAADLSFGEHIAEKIHKADSIVGLIHRSFNCDICKYNLGICSSRLVSGPSKAFE